MDRIFACARSERLYLAGVFEPWNPRIDCVRWRRIKAAPLQDVRAIDSEGADANADFLALRLGNGDVICDAENARITFRIEDNCAHRS